MENVPITMDGEPPIYREMKPVSVTLESCLLNSEQDFPYNKMEQTLVTKNNCDDGELSAEEISSMIMINEGPNALSSIQEKLESNKFHSVIRHTSDIKKILTSDLPKAGRFLSTKSLQKLSGAKKVIKKNPKYANEDETDIDDPPDTKNKKVIRKQNKAIKENLDKTNKGKVLENKLEKKNAKGDKLKMKSLKRGNSLEKLPINKKLKSMKKVGINKSKNLNSATKVFKKKTLESNSVVKKKESVSKEPESVTEKDITEITKEKKLKSEKKAKLLTSRSGRIRKIKSVSDLAATPTKEGKISNSAVDQEVADQLIASEPEKKTENVKLPVSVTTKSKCEGGKENRSQRDLLQNVLSESVESWFDISTGAEKRGKKMRGKVKIIPKDSDSCFEEAETPPEEKFDRTSSEVTEVLIDSIKSEDPKSEEQEVFKANSFQAEKIKSEEDSQSSQEVDESPADVSVSEEPTIAPVVAEQDKDDHKRSLGISNKKVKAAKREVMGYKKKRRKTRAITVSRYLKNYGEKINFDVKLDPEEDAKMQIVSTDGNEGTRNIEKNLAKVDNSNDLERNNKIEGESGIKESSDGHITSPIKRSPSDESLQTSRETKIESQRKSIEMPACLPLRESDLKELHLNCEVLLKRESLEEMKKNNIKSLEIEAEARAKNSEKNEPVERKSKTSSKEKLEKEETVTDTKSEKEKKIKNQNRKHQNLFNTKLFGRRNKRKQLWAVAKRRKSHLRKTKVEIDKKQEEEEEKPKISEPPLSVEIVKTKELESKENNGVPESSVVKSSFSANSAFTIPLKKRPRRIKVNEVADEMDNGNKEETNISQKADCERRKSHREIKLTPKIVDLIATSSSHRRSRKNLTCKEVSVVVKGETASSAPTSVEDPEAKPAKEVTEPPLAAASSVENYLQSKMEANASNFESSWEPGDLVWARFAGNPFWPALILRDPFSNDEYSRVKYLGRLPRPFVHVQFLADYGRRAWGPELYIMIFNGLEEFEKLKSNLPEVNAFTQRKDLMYQQAFFAPKKMEKNWMDAIKEAETLINKSKDERITYMKIKYPLVKYAASVANGRLVPNERIKSGDSKSPQSKFRKRRSLSNVSTSEETSSHWAEKENEDSASKDTFECVNTSDMDEEIKKGEKDPAKITLKLVRSPNKGSKRKSKSIDGAEDKKMKKRAKKEVLDDDYAPSDSGSNGEKGSETSVNKQKKYFLFRGARTEKVCQMCFEILENVRTVKCKGACLGVFHKSCAEKMSATLPPSEDSLNSGVKKRRKKLFADGDGDNVMDLQSKGSDEKEWRCNDCLRGENPCFVCNSKSGNRQRCCVAYCGKFYHQKCLKLYPQTIYNQGAPIKKSQALQQSETSEAESPHYQILSCPLHVCHTCASDNPADFNMKYLCEKLVKCIKCPSAYHGGNYCVPAGSTILNTSQIICAKHGDPGKKSHVNISWCFICNMGGSLICCEWCPSSFHLDCLNIKPPDGAYICEECESGRFPLYGEVVWVKLGRYRWWPARVLFPQEILPNIMALPHKPWEFAVRFYGSNDHYWLNRGRVFLYQEGDSEQKFKGQSHVDKIYQRAVQEATKDYFAIQEERKSRLLGTNNSGVMKPPPYVRIKTNKAVGKVQLGNLSSQSEPQTCDCDPNSEAPCSPGSDCLNRMLLVECDPNYCSAGSRCQNQSFEKREYPPLEPYRTETRGWGLRSTVDIAKGTFVIEYVGEVVDDEEFKRRMKRKQETKDSNYYFLTIDKDRTIDAGPKGNLARFMNHSCSPNCDTQKWTVNGDTRVGLFALRDIPAGTELTFNYNLDCIGNEKKACNCEEENCSGFIGVKVKNDKSDVIKNKIIKRLEKESEDECFMCNDGGELMVCDVPNCPKVYHLECVNLTEWPNEFWFCPRHRCSVCNRTTKRCCKLCPAAYCFAHLDNNMFSDSQGGVLCSKHSTCAVKPAQTLRKASYINRNSPVVEYEKPFAEKYRPPPPQKEGASSSEKKEEILMEPNLTDNTPIVVENPLLTSTASHLNDGVSVQVLYVDEEGQIVSVDECDTPNTGEPVTGDCEKEDLSKPVKKKKKRTNIPRKKLNPPVVADETEKKQSSTQGGINFESLMIKSVEDKILDSKLNMDNIYNIIGGGGEDDAGQTETDSTEGCIRDDSSDLKPETVSKKEDAEVDRSRRSKYFKIITPEKFIKASENESNQKKVTDFNYIEFMHPLRSARSKTKTDENTRK